METKVLGTDAEGLKCAKEIILNGGVVAFPTETVYGLGANALNAGAVKKIFEAKGRPSDNPLIVHVATVEMISEIAEGISEDAKKVIKAFMPGPLTIVLKKKPYIPDIATAGLRTVAVRMPSSKEARAFLKAVGVPIAAPSANTSTRPSPTSWRHVLEDLGGKIPLVLKGKDCEVGIESTVLDFTRGEPVVLRPGIVTPSELSAVLNKEVKTVRQFDNDMNSPGIKYKHYAPSCEVWLNTDGSEKKVAAKLKELTESGKSVGVAARTEFAVKPEGIFLDLGVDEKEGAKRIFGLLREAEKRFDAVIVVWDFTSELGESVLNRLLKSCEEKVF